MANLEARLAQQTRDTQLFLGRLLIGGVFLFAGIQKILFFDRPLAELDALNLWLPSMLVLSISLTVEFFAGLAIVIGFQIRLAAWLLFVWCLPLTFIMHWPTDPNQTLHFIKNLALLGAFQLLMISGPGAYSLDVLLGDERRSAR